MTLTEVINPVVPLNLLFPHQRVICPHSRQSSKYRIVTHNITNDDITNGKTLVIIEAMDMIRPHWNNGVSGTIIIYISTMVHIV